jgi:two-component system phosphate regulon sensor histidine kinase PhoR
MLERERLSQPPPSGRELESTPSIPDLLGRPGRVSDRPRRSDHPPRPVGRAKRFVLSIRGQLGALAVLAIVVIFGLGYQIAARTLHHREEVQARAHHLIETRLAARLVAARGELDEALVRELEASLGVTISIVAADGRLLHGDRPPEDLAGVDPSDDAVVAPVRSDPEALRGVARATLRSGETVSVFVLSRVARSEDTLTRFRGLTLAAAAVALVLAGLFIEGVVRRLSLDVADLADAATRMARGDLHAGADAHLSYAIPELRELAKALQHLAQNLSSALGQLASDRDLFGSVLDGMREGVLVLDQDGRIALANPAFRQTLLSPRGVIGKLPSAAIESPRLVEVLEDAHENRRPVSAEVSVGRLMPRRLAVHAAPVAATSAATVAVFVDVTELRKLETMRRDFVANVSHELRTPITVIRATAETLEQSKWGDAMANEFVSIIERNAERLQRLVDDLLDLSRMDSGNVRLTFERVSIEPLVRSVVAAHAETARKRGVKFIVEVGKGADQVLSDRGAIEQIVTNLVENEVKYAVEKAPVTLSTAIEDGRFVVLVSDRGPGIAEVHLSRLFERFYRVDAGRSRELGGTGLGLAIVKHLAETLGGAVSVESEVGKGTTFRLVLPLQPSVPPPDPTPLAVSPLALAPTSSERTHPD